MLLQNRTFLKGWAKSTVIVFFKLQLFLRMYTSPSLLLIISQKKLYRSQENGLGELTFGTMAFWEIDFSGIRTVIAMKHGFLNRACVLYNHIENRPRGESLDILSQSRKEFRTMAQAVVL